jgi:ecotin
MITKGRQQDEIPMPNKNRSNNTSLIISIALWAGMLAVSVASNAEHTDRAGTSASGRAADHLQAFPPSEAGMIRHVLHLPSQRDESLYKVELIVGKTVKTDPHNRYFFTGRIESESIQGWGFTRYVIKTLGPMAGTRMAVPPNTPNAPRFITLGGEPYFIRYNSKLPIVVYAPEIAEVRYRIWSSGSSMASIPQG